MQPNLLVHHTLISHGANGPGRRFVIWLQGCTLGCEGCFNPETHGRSSGQNVDVDTLASHILNLGDTVTGITVTGGEPLQQAESLSTLLKRIRIDSTLSIILLTGFTLSEIQRIPFGAENVALADVVLAGRYDSSQHVGRSLRGSANKKIYFVTDRYRQDNFDALPDAEVVISENGDVAITGIAPPALNFHAHKKENPGVV